MPSQIFAVEPPNDQSSMFQTNTKSRRSPLSEDNSFLQPSPFFETCFDGAPDDEEALGSYRVFMLNADELYDEIERAAALRDKGAVSLSQATSSSGKTVTSRFIEMFETELSRVTSFLQAQQETQEMSAKAFLSDIDIIVKKNGNSSMIAKSLRHKAEGIIKECLDVSQFISSNKQLLAEIAEYADKHLGTASNKTLLCRFSVAPWKGLNSTLVVVLSDIYEVIRLAEQQRHHNAHDKWEAPSSFERSTTKYWIEQDKLTDVLMTLVKEAPLLVYGKSGRLTGAAECKQLEGDKLWESLATPISSVYFDSASMSMYKERIARHEGAQLFRVRWYGNKPRGSEILFLELKTHHEKWINCKSVKERVNIQEKDMSKFLAREKWTREDAQRIVMEASPKLREEALAKATDLLLTMHKLVVSKDLRPCVRSVYMRAAFQSPKSNDLRLTIDRDITLIDESGAREGEWCLPDDAIIGETMVAHAPYPVFEVKLSGSEMPDSISDLIANGLILEAAKFSKFLTGAAAFNAVKTLPYWSEHPSFAEMFSMPVKAVRIYGTASTQGDVKKLHSNTASETSTEPSTLGPMPTEISTSGIPLRRKSRSSATEPTSAPPKRTIAAKKPARVEPKSYFANERTFIQWISAALLLVTISALLMDRDGGTDSGSYLWTTSIGLSIGAGLVVVYSAFVYFRRLRLLSKGSAYGYVDHIGPLLLAGAVLSGVVVLLVHKKVTTAGTIPSLPVLREESGTCYQYPNNGISGLLYQPSGIAIDNEREMLLVPSLQQIIAHSTAAGSSSADIATLTVLPDEDLEGITVAGDRVFALSEAEPDGAEAGTKHGSLIELEWQGDKLEFLQRWEIHMTSLQAEGLAFVPDDQGDGSLYITAGPEVHIFEIPTAETTQLQRRGTLNNKLLLNGLQDTKIADMYQFEGILYVLHDNDRVIRAWDLETAILVAEIPLPRVADEFASKQWECFAIERNTNGSDGSQQQPLEKTLRGGVRLGQNLKGAVSAPLIVHLALDTPAQVWSFAVEEGSVRGSFTFPSCAAAVF